MSKLKQIEELRVEVEQCVKCGACRAHCPVFGAEQREGRVARGKVALVDAVLRGDVSPEEVLEDLSQCLLCGSCGAHCPNKVPTDEIVAAARRRIAEKGGLSLFGMGLTSVIGRPKLMNALAKTSGKFSKLLFKQLPEKSGLRLRFPAPYLAADRTMPPLTDRPFRERVPEVIEGRPEMPTIAFFTGCGINYMYPAIGEAFLQVMSFLGVTVIIPKDQACCGLPAISAGAGNVVEQLAAQNLAALTRRPVDYVVTACASCNAGLGKIYSDLGDDYAAMGEKTRDIFVLLVELGLPVKLASLPRPAQRIQVTYHDPCHLRTRGVTLEPRQILAALPQVEFVEMAGAGVCCGMGGTYSVYHYETAKKIGAKKASSIAASGADLVATDCPGCIMQLQDAINHADGKQRAVHILELLAAVLPQGRESWKC